MCVWHVKWLWFERYESIWVLHTVLWHLITPSWKMSDCGSWGRKPGEKNVTPTGGSQITDTYQLSVIWLIWLCGCKTVDIGTISVPDGYHCQMLSLVLSLCSSKSCIFFIQIVFVLFLRCIVWRKRFCTNIGGAILCQRGNNPSALLFTLAYIKSYLL